MTVLSLGFYPYLDASSLTSLKMRFRKFEVIEQLLSYE
jgi:hypothetical protein